MPVSTTIEPGTILAGKYKVGHELGRGGMAAVYEATHVEIGKRVAIKLLAGHLTKSSAVVERFLREARAVAAIRSPYICDIFDSGKNADGVPFLVLELLEGESLYDRMVRDRQMSVPFTLAILLQTCKGLSKAHDANIVHRDLKPENIYLVNDDEGGLHIKILDFGLAKFYEEPQEQSQAEQKRRKRLTRDGAVFGTPTYMSPEQVRGQGRADARSDLWALACIAYECLTGTTVWSTDEGVAMTFVRIASSPLPDPSDLRPDLPESFNIWFLKALNRELEGRYQNVRELADGLVDAFGYQAAEGGFDAALIKQLADSAPEWQADKGLSRPPPPAMAPSGPGLGQLKSDSGQSAQPTPVPSEDRPPRGRRWLATWGLVLVALLVAGGISLGIWSRQQPTAASSATPGLVSGISTVSTAPAAERNDRHLINQHPWLEQVRQAQQHLSKGEHDEALALLRKAFEAQQHPMVGTLLDQVQIALLARSNAAPCQVTGYARPRRYDLIDPSRKPVGSSPPTLAWGPQGAVVAWSDPRDSVYRAHAVRLDQALQNSRLPVDITPEGKGVRTPTLLPTDDRILAVYWDGSAAAAGVFVRWLTPEGVIASAPVAVTEPKPGRYMATGATSGKRHIVAWAQDGDQDSVDLFYRSYDDELKPQGAAIRATDFAGGRRSRTTVRTVAMGVTDGAIHLAYGLQRNPLAQVRYQAVPLDTKPPGIEGPDGGIITKDRTLGAESLLSDAREQGTDPAIGCTAGGCFVAWHGGAKTGASVLYVDAKTHEVRWNKQLKARVKHPAIGVTPRGEAILAWLEGGRLMVAPLGSDGVGPHSKVARVVGEQPAPAVAGGSKPGEWLLAWSDFEAAHLEPYVVRVQCP